MKVNFFNHSQKTVKEYEKLIDSIFKTISKKGSFNLIFVEKEEIKTINQQYRNIDKVTDVISFALLDDKENIANQGELGDIFICLDRAFVQAKEFGHSISREIGFLAVHGYLHLCGYDHLTKDDEIIMRAKQEEILGRANLKRGV